MVLRIKQNWNVWLLTDVALVVNVGQYTYLQGTVTPEPFQFWTIQTGSSITAWRRQTWVKPR